MTQEEEISPLVSTEKCMIRVRHTVPRQKAKVTFLKQIANFSNLKHGNSLNFSHIGNFYGNFVVFKEQRFLTRG